MIDIFEIGTIKRLPLETSYTNVVAIVHAAAVALLEAPPRWNGGRHIFTTTGGEKPINGFSKAKARIDKLSGVSGWVIHDLRRSVRTHLSALPVEDLVRELVIAHAKPGLHRIYDRHGYQDEKRRCLELWEARLLPIVEPPWART